MRILLTTLNAKYIHINLALRYLRACCRDLPLEFILDEFTINDRPEHIAAAIYRHRPDLVAFSCYIWNLEPTLTVAAMLKTVRPDLPILCGGPEVSFEVEDFLTRHPEIDLIITGEGEIPFRALMEQLAAGSDWVIPAGLPAARPVATLAGQPSPVSILIHEGKAAGNPAGLPGQLPGGRCYNLSGQPYIKQFSDISIPRSWTRLHPRSLAAVPGLAWRRKGKIRFNPPLPITSAGVSAPVPKGAAGNLPLPPGDASAQSRALSPTAAIRGSGPLFQRPHPEENPFPGNPSPSPVYKDLDVIPFPYEEDLADGGDLQQRTVYYETSRGCPFACSFCLSSTTTGLRCFSLARVRDDLARLLAAGAREIKFVDRTFNAHKKRALAIWEYLLSLQPAARFYFEIAGDRLDDEMLAFLSQAPAGLFQFEIGVQSIDAEVNARCNRRQDWDRLAANVRRLQAAGNIRLHLDLIAGLPGETYTGVGQSFDAVAALEPNEIQLGFLKLLPGTDLRARAAEFGYLFLNRPPYQVLASNTITYAEMLRLHDIEAVLKYYGNSHLADHALAYLVQTAFGGSHFACYEALAAWWAGQDLCRRGHSQRDFFNHLAAFTATLTGEIGSKTALAPSAPVPPSAPYAGKSSNRKVVAPNPGNCADPAAIWKDPDATIPSGTAKAGQGSNLSLSGTYPAGVVGNAEPAGPDSSRENRTSGYQFADPASITWPPIYGESTEGEPAEGPESGQPFMVDPVWPGSFHPLTAAQLERFYQLLKFGFLCRDRSRHWPLWVPPSPLTEKQRSAYQAQVTAPGFIEKNWPALAKEAPASLRRHGFIELFPCHPEKPKEGNPTLVFFYYGPPGRETEVYYLSPAEFEPTCTEMES